MARLLTIHLVGEAWRNGQRMSGWCHAQVEGEQYPRYYREDHCPASIVKDLTAKGIDCDDYDHWVKTGQGGKVI